MIICHEYEFIFLKTRKTASSSMDIAFSQFCGPDAVITPLGSNETIRQNLGYPGPSNSDNWPFSIKSITDLYKYLYFIYRRFSRAGFLMHMTAEKIRNRIPPRVWNNYYKFCFERNPYDKAISRYYWQIRKDSNDWDQSTDMLSVFRSIPDELLSNWYIYTIDDEIAVDKVARFENLNEEMSRISEAIGLPKIPELPKTNTNSRKNRDHYSKVLDSKTKEYIESVCEKEIKHFDYSF